MKYKVSLLPEYNRKRLNGKKKLEKIKVYSLVALVILAMFTFVVIGTHFFANQKLEQARKLDREYAQKVAELEHFREINATLQNKVNLIEDIQVEEPQLVNFVTTVANLKHPGISISSIECTEWKTTRNCVLTGSCDTREQYLSFEKALNKIEGVSAVACAVYTPGVTEDGFAQFTINVTCSGGAAIVTTTEETTASGEKSDKDSDEKSKDKDTTETTKAE